MYTTSGFGMFGAAPQFDENCYYRGQRFDSTGKKWLYGRFDASGKNILALEAACRRQRGLPPAPPPTPAPKAGGIVPGYMVPGAAAPVPAPAPAPAPVIPQEPVPGMIPPIYQMCAERGGTVQNRGGTSLNPEQFCVFPDGSECSAFAVYHNQCAALQPAAASTTAAGRARAMSAARQRASTSRAAKAAAQAAIPDTRMTPEFVAALEIGQLASYYQVPEAGIRRLGVANIRRYEAQYGQDRMVRAVRGLTQAQRNSIATASDSELQAIMREAVVKEATSGIPGGSIVAKLFSGALGADVPQPEPPGPGGVPPIYGFCKSKGGQVDEKSGDCVLANGSRCDAWAFFRGECSPANPARGKVLMGGTVIVLLGLAGLGLYGTLKQRA